MNIREMRTALDKQNRDKGFSSLPATMPDWVVKHTYEKRNGLPLSPIPAAVRVIKTQEELRAFLTENRAQREQRQLAARKHRAAEALKECQAEIARYSITDKETETLLRQARAELALLD